MFPSSIMDTNIETKHLFPNYIPEFHAVIIIIHIWRKLFKSLSGKQCKARTFSGTKYG